MFFGHPLFSDTPICHRNNYFSVRKHRVITVPFPTTSTVSASCGAWCDVGRWLYVRVNIKDDGMALYHVPCFAVKVLLTLHILKYDFLRPPANVFS